MENIFSIIKMKSIVVLVAMAFTANSQMIPSPQMVPTVVPTPQALPSAPASSKNMVGKAYGYAS
jgi:hypothetical protein